MVWSKPVLITLGVLVVSALFLRTFVFDVIWIQSSRFTPDVYKGDLVFALKGKSPSRGDFVSHSCNIRNTCLSQVLGVEGDRIDIDEELELFINEKKQRSLDIPPNSDAPLPTPTSLVVPPGAFFVGGDIYGVLEPSQITSVFDLVLLSVDSGGAGLRWSRVGHRIH